MTSPIAPSNPVPAESAPAALRHTTVLLAEAVEAVTHRLDGVYVDGTFGRGGHARALLARLGPAARLIGIDKDPEAVQSGEALAAADPRFTMLHASLKRQSHRLRRSARPCARTGSYPPAHCFVALPLRASSRLIVP